MCMHLGVQKQVIGGSPAESHAGHAHLFTDDTQAASLLGSNQPRVNQRDVVSP